jgi:acyl-CoA thioesterase-1
MSSPPGTARDWRRSLTDLLIGATGVVAGVPALPGPLDRFRRWCEGVSVVAADRARFAEHWERHNERALRRAGPLWVALGDSAAQGLGAWHPEGGYVSQALAELRRRTGDPWRVVNWSRSGATSADVLADQLPRLDSLDRAPDLVTIGTGTNDLMRYPLPRVRSLFRELIDRAPESTVVLDVPVPYARWWGLGPVTAPLVVRLNTFIRAESARRGLPVAAVSTHFTRPWQGRFGPDDFHPNQDGYRLWAEAVLAAARFVPAVAGLPSHDADEQRIAQPGTTW